MRGNKENNDLEEFSIGDESVEVSDRGSGIQGGSIKKKLIYILIVVVGFFFAYKFFSSESQKEDTHIPARETQVEERVVSDKIKTDTKEGFLVPKDDAALVLLPPKISDLPKLPAIPVPAIPEKPPVVPTKPGAGPSLPSFFPQPPGSASSAMDPPGKVSSGINKYNRSTPMIAFGGGGVTSSEGQSSGISISDPASLLDPSKLGELRRSLQQRDTTAPEDKELTRTPGQIVAGYVGDLDYVLTEGKMLDAVLETAVNTDLKAKVRAVVSRDVFSESGNQILIPKGSRLIGSYSTDISFTQSRVDITWSRIILPNGIDINLGGFDGVDSLGRAGVRGAVNNKVSNVMSTSILLATARVASGMIVDKIMGTNKSQMNVPKNRPSLKDENADESKVKGSPGAIIAMQAIQDASKQVTDYVKRTADVNPTLTVNQGTRLKVFVNQDVVFPRAAFQEYKVLN
ncbi:TrbI/VirB10 family protein [Neorickettsia sennetsu]|uniref:Type IV secretion system protein VirB10 n=1 Tax=Ehrlichia sennetsu (strain ATCC VR-367 / Miyayama) TaxID=222891 RepID=Q2GD29_EHRS3|nr:TrbI/VirB10 family protein [Neorickettsia sennetsu]ABD46115.1 type IV secretion system protein VirB10 [Neorickettsia sennetsu str. Miyayama]